MLGIEVFDAVAPVKSALLRLGHPGVHAYGWQKLVGTDSSSLSIDLIFGS